MKKASENHHKKINQIIRPAVQILFFIVVAFTAVVKYIKETGVIVNLPEVSLHTICPFGGVVTIYQFLATGTLVQKVHESAFVLLVITVLMAILFGAVFCGWICPLGSVQEWLGKLGKKILGKHYNHVVPPKMDKYLRFLRYIVLIWVVYVTAASAKLLFQSVDPYYALFNFYSGEVAVDALVILGITLLGSLIIERPWCKYACPYGALLGLSNLLSVFKIRRNKNTCISCSACDKACPMNITVSDKKVVKNHQCIRCMKCTSDDKCPIPDTVSLAFRGEKNEN